jgi:hypothetical protein
MSDDVGYLFLRDQIDTAIIVIAKSERIWIAQEKVLIELRQRGTVIRAAL